MNDDKPVALIPVMTTETAVGRYNAMVEYVRTIMNEGVDYAQLPGTSKPTLLKPGAEKLARLFGLGIGFEIVSKVEDFSPDNPFVHYHFRCRLTRDGVTIAEGDGSCNSREEKYAFEWTDAPKPDDAAIESMKITRNGRFVKRGGAWQWQEKTVCAPARVFTIMNTILKMAQKRALVAAVLMAVSGSEFFTQDLEDIPVPDGGTPFDGGTEGEIVGTARDADRKTTTPPQRARIYALQVRAKIAALMRANPSREDAPATQQRSTALSQTLSGVIDPLFENLGDGQTIARRRAARMNILGYLAARATPGSTNDLRDIEAEAVLRWATQDTEGFALGDAVVDVLYALHGANWRQHYEGEE
jgi:hypothetical protein